MGERSDGNSASFKSKIAKFLSKMRITYSCSYVWHRCTLTSTMYLHICVLTI